MMLDSDLTELWSTAAIQLSSVAEMWLPKFFFLFLLHLIELMLDWTNGSNLKCNF